MTPLSDGDATINGVKEGINEGHRIYRMQEKPAWYDSSE